MQKIPENPEINAENSQKNAPKSMSPMIEMSSSNGSGNEDGSENQKNYGESSFGPEDQPVTPVVPVVPERINSTGNPLNVPQFYGHQMQDGVPKFISLYFF